MDRTLSWMRWTIIAAMWIITLLWPVQGRMGHAVWMLILSFAGYNVLIEVARHHVAQLRSFAWVPVPDLLMVGLLYFLDWEPGGPTFVFFYLALLTAAATQTLRRTALYTVAVVITVAIIAPTLPGWSPSGQELRQLSSRIVVMILVGVGTSILTRRLVLEYEQARSMRDEAERLEELDRLREEFVSSVSHDLRTPLTAMKAGLGLLEMKLSDRLEADEQQMWGNARRNVERLGRLIDDLLALNQLKAGVLQLNCKAVDLRTVITDALSAVYPLVREKGQTLEVDLPVPLPVQADAWRMEQVIVNVLVNAHRHTPAGTHIVIADGSDARQIAISMRDTGPGIPAEELEAIFERFHRVSTAGTGSGLGLAIARALVELHGGQLWAESRLGAGATFRMTLPRSLHGEEL
jgi:signal transduction histidine kinase